MNRREFCIGVGSALGMVTSGQAHAEQTATTSAENAGSPAGQAATAEARPLRPLGWRAYASRYIAPPVLRFEPVANAVEYRAEIQSPNPVVPVVMEQYRCYKPVECCNAWLFEALLAAHKATGQDVYLQKSRALAAALSHWRRPNGSFATWCFYTSPDRPKEAGDWFACVVYDGHMLMRHEKVLLGS